MWVLVSFLLLALVFVVVGWLVFISVTDPLDEEDQGETQEGTDDTE